MHVYDDLQRLPPDLPMPVDDGAAAHLLGAILPAVPLVSTAGGSVVAAHLERRAVIFAYPMTGTPDASLPQGWDEIPGARGCTTENLSFKDAWTALEELGVDVYGLSTQSTEYQNELVGRLALPFPILSDPELIFVRAMKLPTMIVDGSTLLKRLTLIVDAGRVEKVCYPVFPPNAAAEPVLEWLRRRAAPDVDSQLRRPEAGDLHRKRESGGVILEWVEFDLPPGTTRAEALALYRGTAESWAANPDLVGKTYTFNEESCIGGGLYVWRTREAMARWHGEGYLSMIRVRYGSEPRIRVSDAVLEIAGGKVLDGP